MYLHVFMTAWVYREAGCDAVHRRPESTMGFVLVHKSEHRMFDTSLNL